MITEVLRTLGVFHPNNDLVEVRTKWDNLTLIGRQRDHKTIARWVGQINSDPSDLPPNILFTLNQLPPGSLWEEAPLNSTFYTINEAVKNVNITRIGWLFVDVDALREDTKKPATEAEIQEAAARAKQAIVFLYGYGFPEPVVAFSGNGWHLLYKTKLLNLPETSWMLRSFTKLMHGLFKTDSQSHGASQVLRLYGSVNPKGGRPTKLESVPDPMHEVSEAAILKLLTAHSIKPYATRTAADGQALDDTMDAFLEHCELEVVAVEEYQGGTKWLLSECPFCGYRKRGAAVIIRFPSGKPWFGCVHKPTCEDVGWDELVKKMEAEHGECDFEESDDDLAEKAGWNIEDI